MDIRIMTINDYEKVYGLWKTIKGFGIRSVDDSREGIERFLKRNPTTSITAWEGDTLIGAILCGHDGRRGCTMCASAKASGEKAWEKLWSSPVWKR